MCARKLNCWEFNGCDRCEHGDLTAAGRPCPATVDNRCDGVNGGINGGRACWAVAGTMSGRPPAGVFAALLGNCEACSFYQLVREEEGDQFCPADRLTRRRSPRALRPVRRTATANRVSSSGTGEHRD